MTNPDYTSETVIGWMNQMTEGNSPLQIFKEAKFGMIAKSHGF